MKQPEPECGGATFTFDLRFTAEADEYLLKSEREVVRLVTLSYRR